VDVGYIDSFTVQAESRNIERLLKHFEVEASEQGSEDIEYELSVNHDSGKNLLNQFMRVRVI
jgi:hypothetical protein